MLGGIGPTEMVIVLVIILLFFGAGKLPEVGGAMGKAIRSFKKATNDPFELESEFSDKQISKKIESQEKTSST